MNTDELLENSNILEEKFRKLKKTGNDTEISQLKEDIINFIKKIDVCIEVLTNDFTQIYSKLDNVERTSLRASVQVENLEKRVEELRKTILLYNDENVNRGSTLKMTAEPDNGELLWPITHFKQRFEQTETFDENGITSSTFLVGGKYGYRMRLRMFLKGTDKGRESHLSLYVSILKSSYDAILKWPFQGIFKFILHSSNTAKNHVFQFKSNDCASFQKPTSESNPDNGLSQFYPLSKLLDPSNSHVMDDTLFVHAKVVENFPKTFL